MIERITIDAGECYKDTIALLEKLNSELTQANRMAQYWRTKWDDGYTARLEVALKESRVEIEKLTQPCTIYHGEYRLQQAMKAIAVIDKALNTNG